MRSTGPLQDACAAAMKVASVAGFTTFSVIFKHISTSEAGVSPREEGKNSLYTTTL